MGRAGGRSRCSTTGNQLVCRRTQAVLQNADRLIQGSPPYRVHDRGTPQVRVGQDSEASFAGEVLGRGIQASVMRPEPQENWKSEADPEHCDELRCTLTSRWSNWTFYEHGQNLFRT